LKTVRKAINLPETALKKENMEKIDRQALIEKWRGEDISRIKTGKKVIALTFDGGANADGIAKILSILKIME